MGNRTDRPHRKALVLGDPGSDIQSFLSVIRSLGRGGIEVHVGWCPPRSDALWSRYVARRHELPIYCPGAEPWKAALIDLMDREIFDLVDPLHRSVVDPFAGPSVRAGAAGAARCPRRRLPGGQRQARGERAARSVGLKLPRGLVVERLEQVEEVRAELGLPVVLKPQWSYDRASVGARRSVRFVDSWADLEATLRAMLPLGPVAAQEIFRGRGVGVELLLHEGEPLLEFQHVRLHEPPRGGAGSYRQSLALSPELRDAPWPCSGRCATRAWRWSSSRWTRRPATGCSSKSTADSGAPCPWR